jgi:hypothetical protein
LSVLGSAFDRVDRSFPTDARAEPPRPEVGDASVRLEPLYRVTFWYPEAWLVELEDERGVESEHFFIAEGRCEGRITGRLRGANHPHRRTDLTYVPDYQGVIEADDGATILFDYRGYGRAYPEERRQVVGFAKHFAGDERYKWLNDVVCAVSGEVQPGEERTEIVLDVAELVWEPLPERPRYDLMR